MITHELFRMDGKKPKRVPCPDEACHEAGHKRFILYLWKYKNRTVSHSICTNCGSSEVHWFSKKEEEKSEEERLARISLHV